MKNKEIALGSVCLEMWEPGDHLYDDWMQDNEDYENEVNLDENEIILKGNKEYTLIINYPLTNSFKNKFKTPSEGMTRKELVKIIVNCYRYIYDIEERTSKIVPDHIPNMYNRNTTTGKYGIWGHDLGDLILHTAWVDKDNMITLGVDS